jgi:glutamyl-tRNA synthetase
MTVKTRVAPSPTGDPHVGTAYVALMNYMYARKNGGSFLLRIEDTDRARSSEASERAILESLRWLGLSWDEGPDVGGPNGPYRQSERGEIYQRYADQLLRDGHAFKCFCTTERLATVRREQRKRNEPPRYDGHCLSLTAEEIAKQEAAGTPFVVRMKVPTSGTCVFEDMARGPLNIAWTAVDMQVLQKSDGMPTYHLANVVDDHLMGITHVLRGEEWISSAPKHQLLYGYFGWEMPKLFHLPLLRNPDRSKLSKRKNPTGILFYKRMGYLPQALVNFLGLFGMSSAEGEELASIEEMTARFDIANISLGGPIFDTAKLDWLNGRHIRERLSLEQFKGAVRDWAANDAYLTSIAELAQSRVVRLSDLGPLTSHLFSGRLGLSADALTNGKVPKDALRRVFQMALFGIDALPQWTTKDIEAVLRRVADKSGVKFKDMVRHFYIALSGSPTSLPLFNAMELLGRDLSRERLREALTTLGATTEKEREAWKTEWEAGEPVAAEAAAES